jgi:hypothetical protein
MTQLPSTSQAIAFWEGRGAKGLVWTTALRASVIAAGSYALGVRGENVARAAVGGAVAIELGVLLYTLLQKQDEKN